MTDKKVDERKGDRRTADDTAYEGEERRKAERRGQASKDQKT